MVEARQAAKVAENRMSCAAARLCGLARGCLNRIAGFTRFAMLCYNHTDFPMPFQFSFIRELLTYNQ